MQQDCTHRKHRQVAPSLPTSMQPQSNARRIVIRRRQKPRVSKLCSSLEPGSFFNSPNGPNLPREPHNPAFLQQLGDGIFWHTCHHLLWNWIMYVGVILQVEWFLHASYKPNFCEQVPRIRVFTAARAAFVFVLVLVVFLFLTSDLLLLSLSFSKCC